MSNNTNSRFYHHFMPKTMPCIVLPPVKSPMLSSTSPTSSCNDHILNLSASLNKHCPLKNHKDGSDLALKGSNKSNKDPCEKLNSFRDISSSPDSPVSSVNNCEESDDDRAIRESSASTSTVKVDMNCNDLKTKGDGHSPARCDDEGCSSECHSVISEHDRCLEDDDDEHMTEIDVDDSINARDEESEQEIISLAKRDDNSFKKSKSLAFGIDRILSFSAGEGQDNRDQKPPTSPSEASTFRVSPPVVSNTSSKSATSTDTSKDDNSKTHHHHHHHSILSKLKLCATSLPTSETQRRSSGLPYFHHSYGPFHHHHHHLNSIITSTSSAGGGIHNLNSHHHHPQAHHHNHQHPLSHCSECLFYRRYSGNGGSGGSSRAANNRAGISNISSSSSASSAAAAANNVATNNMQFSSSMATPCGPISSAISASFTWMANPSIYDNSAIISPVAGYNQHVPLQPTFGISTSGYSTLHTMQQCSSGGTSGRRKRSWSRAVFSNLQRKGLEKRFQLQKYITKPDRRQLAATLGLTDAQVKVWFQNRRMKWRHSKEGKVSSGTGEGTAATPSSSPVTSTTSSKMMDGAIKDKKG